MNLPFVGFARLRRVRLNGADSTAKARKGSISEMERYQENAVVAEAAQLVQAYIEDIEIATGIRGMLMDNRSRFICRCPSCRSVRERTESWLSRIEGKEPSEAAPVVAGAHGGQVQMPI